MRYSPWSSSSGKVKATSRAKERTESAGTAVKVITTAETARTTNKTTDGQMVQHGRISKAARQAKMPAKDGMQARAIGTVGETVRAKAKTGKGVVSPKNGMTRTDRMIGTRMWKGKSSTKGSSKGSMYSVDKVGDIDWWAQSDGSQHSSQSEEEITSACGARAKCRINDVTYIRKKMQSEDGHMENVRTSKGSTVK